ncbi:hypothetical protein IG631_08916 [Alternaria alternata]|nr:hypothetical protein IG631_08916 [Alternaria alternata]
MNVPFVPPWKATNSPLASESTALKSTVIQMRSAVVASEVLHARILLVAVALGANIYPFSLDSEGNIVNMVGVDVRHWSFWMTQKSSLGSCV